MQPSERGLQDRVGVRARSLGDPQDRLGLQPVPSRSSDRPPLQPRRRHPRQVHLQQGRSLRLQLVGEAQAYQEA